MAVAAAGLGALSAVVCALGLLTEVTMIFITSTMVKSQLKEQGGNTVLPSNRKLDERSAEHGPAHQNKTKLPLSQSLPSGSSHKPLILIHQRVDRLKTTITEN